jgi:ribosomal protein S18 acetylase RimI-like enzyme
MSQQMQYKIRSLTSADQSLLWEMLYLSLFVPEGNEPFERSILKQPDISKYVDGWGRADDFGFVAVDEMNQPLGAIWLRLLSRNEKGYGYVDDFTPELGMAVFPEYRGLGIGTSLLKHLIESVEMRYEQISLSVGRENPALRLYQRFGFEVIAEDENSLTMRKKIKGE